MIKLWTLFDSEQESWQEALSPVYGERNVTIRFLCRDLIWRPLRTVARFVLVDHPARVRMILITTDLTLPPIEVIRLYGLRFKIELSFKHALRVLGTYAYHFWMQAMPKISRLNGRIALEYLPAYAPELNPVEYIWGYLKHHAMPNYCARDLTDLRQRASCNLRSVQRRGTLVTAFWKQAELF